MAIVGRNACCDIVLASQLVSARHALLQCIGGQQYRIQDLGSTNGTFVNGVRVSEATIRPRDTIALGGHVLDLRDHATMLELEYQRNARGLTIGHDRSCDMVVTDPRVSARHALLVPEEHGFRIVDLGSRNGISVNGQQVSQTLVGPGDRVELGSCPVDLLQLVRQRSGAAVPEVPITAPPVYRPPKPIAYPASPEAGGMAVAPVLEYAGFWRRLAAALIDGLVLSVGTLLYLVLGWYGYIVQSILAWIYFAGMESSERQATLGKMALGIQVTDLAGTRISFLRATGRYFAKMVSGLTLMVGYIMAGFTARKQALHDMLAGCLVVMRS